MPWTESEGNLLVNNKSEIAIDRGIKGIYMDASQNEETFHFQIMSERFRMGHFWKNFVIFLILYEMIMFYTVFKYDPDYNPTSDIERQWYKQQFEE